MHLVMALSVWLAVAGVTPEPSARLQVIYPSATLDGTCALVWTESNGAETLHYFVTSLQFFRDPQGNPYTPQAVVRIVLDDGRTFDVPRQGVILPMGNLVDLAILRVATPTTITIPNSVVLDPLSADTAFAIAGHDNDGAAADIPQHARQVSTRLMVGDRDASLLQGCLGAPAVVDSGVVGIVSRCEPGHAPIITLLSAAYPFLARGIPGLLASPTLRD
jgi:hypothetical protein